MFLYDYIIVFLTNPFEDSIVSVGYFSNLFYDSMLFSMHNVFYVANRLVGDSFAYSSDFFFFKSSNLFFTFFAILFFMLYNMVRSVLVYNKRNVFYIFYIWLETFVYSKMLSPYIHLRDARFFSRFYTFFFLLILCNNMHGLLAFGFSLTSNLSYTLYLSMSIWYCNAHALGYYNRRNTFSLFLPSSLPFVMFPLFVGIETLSYLIRMVSLALRIFANIVSGHLLIETLCNLLTIFVVDSTYSLDIFDVPYILCISIALVCILLFESGIGILQAYIFVTLSIIYFQDVYNCVH